MELPADFFVRPVDGHNDLLSFRYGFELEGKALEEGKAQTVTQLENGDLIIEGYAAVFDGVDREGENFVPGSFQRDINKFLSGQSPLCYHHQAGKCLGKVLDLREEEGKGLYMKARVDGAIQQHPELGTYYQQIKKGSINGLSVGGFFTRAWTDQGPRIIETDFTEVSVTPVAVHPGTKFAVVAGKALEDLEIPAKPEEEGEIRAEDERAIKFLIEELSGIFDRIGKRGEGQNEDAAKIVTEL